MNEVVEQLRSSNPHLLFFPIAARASDLISLSVMALATFMEFRGFPFSLSPIFRKVECCTKCTSRFGWIGTSTSTHL